MIRENMEILNWRWGYVILLSKFIVVSLMAGIVKSFGVLIPEMVESHDGSYATVGLSCSLAGTFVFFSSPVVSLILERVNHRLVAMLGGVMSGACLGSCAFISSNVALGVFLSLTGVGLASVFMPLTLLLNDYFEEKFILVNTISLYGMTAGTMFLPFITERSLQAYGYNGVYVILGALMLNTAVCGATIRKPVFRKVSKRVDGHHARSDKQAVRSSLASSKDNTQCTNIVVGKTAIANENEVALNSEGECTMSDNVNGPIKDESVSGRPGLDGDSDVIDESDEMLGPSTPLVVDLDDEKGDSEIDRRHTDRCQNSGLIKPFVESCYRSFFFNEPLFLFSLLVTVTDGFSIYAWMLFLIPHATFLGFSESRAVFLSTIGGMGGVLGRTALLLLLTKNVDPLRVYVVSGIVCSVAFMMDFMDENYLDRALLAFVQGMCFFIQDTATFAFLKITLKDARNFTFGAGVQCFAFGTGAISSGYITGFLFDVTQSYTKVFNIIGGVQALFAVGTVVIMIFIRRRK